MTGLLLEAARGLRLQLGRRLEARTGLGVVPFEVLLRLGRTPGGRLRMSDLAAQMAMTRSGLTRVVDGLAAAGLVQRVRCPSDGRGTFAELTPRGREVLAEAVRSHLEDLDELVFSRLEDGEVPVLERALRRLRDTLAPEADRTGP